MKNLLLSLLSLGVANCYALETPITSQIRQELVDEALAEIEKSTALEWFDNGMLTRTTVNYGWDYPSLEKGEPLFHEIPRAITNLREAVLHSLGHLDQVDPEDFSNIIVTIYDAGHSIYPHYDRDNPYDPDYERMYAFGETVVGVVLQEDEEGRLTFYRSEDGLRPTFESPIYWQLPESCGITYILEGSLRHLPYYHAVPKVKNRRVSVTFRTVEFYN